MNAMRVAEVQQALAAQDRTREYVSGGTDRTLAPLQADGLRVLDQFQDDLNREFSDAVYDQMLRDPAVSASVDILKALILAEPLRIVSRVQDRHSAEYATADAIRVFVERQIAEADRPMQAMLHDALDAIAYGSALAEIVYEPAEDPVEGRPILRFKDLKTRPRAHYAFVVDRYLNVLGAAATVPGSTLSPLPPADQIIARQKFLLLTFGGRHGDPRGASLLRPAYNAYYLKTQVWPQYLKFLSQFASPSLVGYTPEGAADVEVVDTLGAPVLNPDGSARVISAEEDMLATLLGFQAGTVAVLKGGARVEPLQSQGSGQAFQEAIALVDRQIAMAILKSHRTLLEAEHGSKADTEAAADITDVFVAGLRESLAASVTRDVVYQIVAVNYGVDAARRYAPMAVLRSLPRQDFAKAATALGTLWSARYLHSSQVPEVDALIGLPARDMDDWLGALQEAEEMDRLDRMERLKLLNPGMGGAGEVHEADA